MAYFSIRGLSFSLSSLMEYELNLFCCSYGIINNSPGASFLVPSFALDEVIIFLVSILLSFTDCNPWFCPSSDLVRQYKLISNNLNINQKVLFLLCLSNNRIT